MRGVGFLAGAAAAILVGLSAGPAAAIAPVGSVGGDQIYVSWSDPMFVGNILDGETGQPFFATNQNWGPTAVYSLGGLGQSSTITWGTDTCSPCSAPIDSTLTFTGGIIPNDGTKGTTPFALGDIYYSNGTSLNGTGIFGATLNFFASSDGTNFTPLGSDVVRFTATANDASTGDTVAKDADYVNFLGTRVSFNVYEGDAATATLLGTIQGDPYASPSTLTLDPGQGGSGFIGTSLPGPIPEPASWALMLVGIGGLGGWLRRARSRGVVLA